MTWTLNTLLLVAEQALVYQGGYGGDYGGPRPQFQRYNIYNKSIKHVFHVASHIETGLYNKLFNVLVSLSERINGGFYYIMIQTLLLPKLDGGNKINV